MKRQHTSTTPKLRTAADAVALLERQAQRVWHDPTLGTVEQTRCLVALAHEVLNATQLADLERRLEALEAAVERTGGHAYRRA